MIKRVPNRLQLQHARARRPTSTTSSSRATRRAAAPRPSRRLARAGGQRLLQARCTRVTPCCPPMSSFHMLVSVLHMHHEALGPLRHAAQEGRDGRGQHARLQVGHQRRARLRAKCARTAPARAAQRAAPRGAPRCPRSRAPTRARAPTPSWPAGTPPCLPRLAAQQVEHAAQHAVERPPQRRRSPARPALAQRLAKEQRAQRQHPACACVRAQIWAWTRCTPRTCARPTACS